MTILHKPIQRGRYAIATAAALLMSTAAIAAEPITFGQALELAESRAPSLSAKDLEARALTQEAAAARTLPDPMVSIGVQNKQIDSLRFDDDEMTMKTVGVAQEFVSGSKRRARASAILAQARVSEAERTLLSTEVRAQAALAWLDLHYAQRIESELARLIEEARLDLSGAKAAYAGGRSQLSEVIAAQEQIVAVENRMTENRRDIEAARARLERWVGRPDVIAAGAAPDVSRPPLDLDRIGHVIETHPVIAVYDARLREAAAEVRSATAERRLDPTVEVMYGQRDDRPDMMSVSVSVPVQVNRKNRQNRTILARELTGQQVAAERESAIREHRAEIATDLVAWRAARERLMRYETSLKPLARSQVEAALAAYRGGGGTLALLIAARRARFNLALETLAIEAEAARAWTELYTVTGEGATRPPLANMGGVSQ